MTKKFVLVHGLPGSGKTTLLKSLVSKKLHNKEEAEYLDLDKLTSIIDEMGLIS